MLSPTHRNMNSVGSQSGPGLLFGAAVNTAIYRPGFKWKMYLNIYLYFYFISKTLTHYGGNNQF